jgi:hypothetical protein
MFKHHGLPKDIVSDRDPKFTNKFWRALWKRMGSKLKMNTSFCPQTDGHIERVNLVIQQFLRNYVAMDQQDWVDHLELAKFCYNNSEHSATRSTPFQMVTGKSPIVPTTWTAHGQPPSDASEEVPMVTTWWRKAALVGGGKGQLGKGIQAVQEFCGQVLTRGEVSKRGWSVVEHQEFLIAKRFESQVFGPICGPIQSVRKETFRHLQVRTTGKS